MICARCAKPIGPTEAAEKIENVGASAAGATLFRHKQVCRRAPQQTAPTRR